MNTKKSPPQDDADGSCLLVKVVDDAGNDFEIWCAATLAGFHYEYIISFPNGTRTEISRCVYSCGLNDVSLVYEGAKSEVIAPNGTPVINVGKIVIVQHSNIEATGNVFTGIKPKPGGKDFHMIYDYTKKFRYRLNTVVGGKVTSTDYFASRSVAPVPGHYIRRAEATQIQSLSDFKAALDKDTEFRKLDYPDASIPSEYEFNVSHTDDHPIGCAYIDDKERSGAILLDPTLSGSSFVLAPHGVKGSIPPMHGREKSTLAIERCLFPNNGNAVVVKVDNKRLDPVDIRTSDSMIVFEFPLNDASHHLLFAETSKPKSVKPSRAWKYKWRVLIRKWRVLIRRQ